MQYQFSDAEVIQLEDCRKAFNQFTGSRWSLEKFKTWLVQEALKDAIANAAHSRALRGQPVKAPVVSVVLNGGRNVH